MTDLWVPGASDPIERPPEPEPHGTEGPGFSVPGQGLQCTAFAKRTGERCIKPAMHGSTVCYTHGGNAPQTRRVAGRRMEDWRAIKAVATYGLPITTDPAAELLKEVNRTAGHVAWLAEVIGELEERDLIWGTTDVERRTGKEAQGRVEVSAWSERAGTHVWLQQYMVERTHLVRVCKAALDAGVAERQIALAEEQGALMARVIMAFIADPELGFTPEAQEHARTIAARHLRALSA